MLATSQAYKDMVYTRDFARHFIPEILLQLIDTSAREAAEYSASSSIVNAFYSETLAALTDEIIIGAFDYGTLEDGLFLLNGNKRLMPAYKQLHAGNYGWCTENMSNENGIFTEEMVIECNYDKPIITAGRTLYFDPNYDAVPCDFDLFYYAKGRLIATVPVTGNEAYKVSIGVAVYNYDRLKIQFYTTSKPYRRIHLLEDIPGLYFEYTDKEVISVSLNQVVDVFSNELIAGEISFQVENANKELNILNDEGVERYLQRRQPVDVNLRMVFPDGSTERIPLGSVKLSEWKVPKGGLEASFTARDVSDSLALDEYLKGTFRSTPVSLYELAKEVLIDAGIEDYEIDIQLLNIYTTAPLPIATHKELLRMIAQAGMSVVLPRLDGGVHIKYISPLVSCTNLVLNPGFDTDWTSWLTHTNCEFTQEYIYTGKQSVQVNAGAVLKQTIGSLYSGHKYYVRVYLTTAADITGTGTYLKVNGTNVTVDLSQANIQINEWDIFGAVVTLSGTSIDLEFVNGASSMIVDGFMCLDLTATYGVGNEPDAEWCRDNIRFFKTVLLVPRVKGPNPVDSLDYSVLLDSPEIVTGTPIRSVEANIYNYRAAVTESEVYKGARFITGTETFDIKFNGYAKNCKIEVHSLGTDGEPTETNTATLLRSTIYAHAATLKVQANSEVQIIVKGNAVTVASSQFKVDPTVDTNLIYDAAAKTIDNRLITNKTVAEDVVSFALYWYRRRYEYDFDWRQNPAIELLDPVVVFDDFGKNNTVLITERTINYDDGVLGGSSKGVC